MNAIPLSEVPDGPAGSVVLTAAGGETDINALHAFDEDRSGQAIRTS
jgi:hypothetical protein